MYHVVLTRRPKENIQRTVFPSTMEVSETKIKSSSLVASTFIHRAILPALFSFYLLIFLIGLHALQTGPELLIFHLPNAGIMGVNHHNWLKEDYLVMFVISLWIYLDMTSKFIMWSFLLSQQYGICKPAPNGSSRVVLVLHICR